jgi:transposase
MERKSKTTKALDAYINRQLIHSTVEDVAKKGQITAEIVASALQRCVNKQVNWYDYMDLNTIGIDEIAIRKGFNNYVVVISCKNKQGELSVLAILPDRLKETVKTFLESIPNHLKATVKTVCTDMYDGFVTGACEVFGVRKVVIDRYHVVKLYRDPLDRLRIDEMKRLKQELSVDEYAKLDNMMWILRKHHECLSKHEKAQLSLLYKHSPKLKEAHEQALRLTNIFNTHLNRKHAFTKLERWIESIKNSSLTCFNGFSKTLRKYRSSVLNYFKMRKNSGFVEGLNNKIKVLKRRCYGIHKIKTLFQRLTLDLQGYKRFA